MVPIQLVISLPTQSEM